MKSGEVPDFDCKPFLEAAEILTRADEPERALSVLDNLPAYYRDNPPVAVKQLREMILYTLVTPHAYMSVDLDCRVDVELSIEVMQKTSRAIAVRELVEKLNSNCTTPHIIDMGPGEYWLPIGLHRIGCQFTYHDVSLLQRTAKQARDLVPADFWQPVAPTDRPIIFVAFELIEHLAWPREIAVEALRHGNRMPDYVFLSTPMYTYDTLTDDRWKKREGRAHLRAYTPEEFFMAARKLFPGYNLNLQIGDIMVITGQP